MIRRGLLPIEWGALFLLALSAACLAILAANPFFALPVLLVWVCVAGALAASGVISALRDPLPTGQRLRSALAVPMAVGIVLLALHAMRA